MNGPIWSPHWMSDADHCKWTGVTCKRISVTCNIIKIELRKKNLNGTIPSSLWSLSFLQVGSLLIDFDYILFARMIML